MEIDRKIYKLKLYIKLKYEIINLLYKQKRKEKND